VYSSSDAAGKNVATDFFIEVVIELVIEEVSSVLIGAVRLPNFLTSYY
jgi:hypothetical protein